MIGHLQSVTQNVEDSEEIRFPPKERYIEGTLTQGGSPQVFLFNVLPPKSSALSKWYSVIPNWIVVQNLDQLGLLAESHWISRYFKSNKRTQEWGERGLQRFKTCRKVLLIKSTEKKVLGTPSKRRCNIVFKDFDEIPLRTTHQLRKHFVAARKDILKQLINNNSHGKQCARVQCVMFYPCHASLELTVCCLAPSMAALVVVLRIVPSPTDRAAIHLGKKGNATSQKCLNIWLQRPTFSLCALDAQLSPSNLLHWLPL